jgi:hypothetical protein
MGTLLHFDVNKKTLKNIQDFDEKVKKKHERDRAKKHNEALIRSMRRSNT